MEGCMLCPRQCNVDRQRQRGYCGGGSQVKIARTMLHFGEEPCISGQRGAGGIFFSGCPLGCVFCQNHVISQDNFGAEITVERLMDICLELQEQGAQTLNLVSPTQYSAQIVQALERVKPQLSIPVVYNTSGYETVEVLRRLEGLVDVYLPDFKYKSPELSKEYAAAAHYFAVASQALLEMFRQTGPYRLNTDGILQQGVMVRHLVLPGTWHDSKDIVHWLGAHFDKADILLSLMRQYTPEFYHGENKNLQRRLTTFEYEQVVDVAMDYGFEGYTQDKNSATTAYTPDFNLEGVLEILK